MRRWLKWGLAAVAAVVATLVVLRLTTRKQPPTPQQLAAQRVVPVGIARVKQQDVRLWLDGLGTVTPVRQVTVRTRVDGQLDAVLFEEGQFVRAGDPIAQIDPRPFRIALQQAEGARQRDAAQLKNAKRNYARYRQLYKERLIPQQQAADQRAAVEQLAGAVALDQAAVDNAKLQLEWSRVVAPVSGVTGIRQVDPGNLVHPTDPNALVVITQLDPIDVVFTLPQDELPAVRAGRPPLEVEVFDRTGDDVLATGRLTLIDNLVNAGTATLRLKAEVGNPSHALWPNQFVKARLYTSTRENVVTVPAEALQRGPKGPFVWTISHQGTAEVRAVTVGVVQGPVAIIAQGLSPGEVVVVDGQSQLKPGTQVQPQQRQEAPGKPPGPAQGAGR